MTNTTPKNAQQAIAQANRLQRARQIIKDGYTFTQDTVTNMIAVCKPEDLHASYFIGEHVDGTNGCDCPDAAKGNDCKHLLAWNLLKEQEADEAANWEAQCKRYDEEEGHFDSATKLPRFRELLHAELLQAETRAMQLYHEPFAKKDAVRSWLNKAHRCKKALLQFDETLCKVQIGLLTL